MVYPMNKWYVHSVVSSSRKRIIDLVHVCNHLEKLLFHLFLLLNWSANPTHHRRVEHLIQQIRLADPNPRATPKPGGLL